MRGLPDVSPSMRVSMNVIVAHGAAGLAGFATFAFLHLLAGLISFIYAHQVHVAVNRRIDVTRRLMAGVALAPKAGGGTRVEWSTGREDVAARALYGGLGAHDFDKVQHVPEGAALDQLAKGRASLQLRW